LLLALASTVILGSEPTELCVKLLLALASTVIFGFEPTGLMNATAF
jgi:hypothetical protein